MIREAKPQDLREVIRICSASFNRKERFDAAWLVEILAEEATLYVDDAGIGVLRGFMILKKVTYGTCVRFIAVAPEFRKQGVGKGLLAIVDGPAYAWVREENKASQAMFESSGWFVSYTSATDKNGKSSLWRRYHLEKEESEDIIKERNVPTAKRRKVGKYKS